MNVLVLFTYGVSLKLWKELGIIKREISLYHELQKKGVDFTLLTYGDKKDLNFKQDLSKINALPIKNLIKSRYLPIKLIKSFLLPIKLKNTFRNFDIIKTNQVEGCWIGFLAKILYKKKLIIRAGYEWFRNYLSRMAIQGKKNYLKYLINYIYVYFTELIAYKLADRIVLTNKADINFIIKMFKLKRKQKKIIHLPNFVDVNQFKPLIVEKKEKHILFVGRLVVIKNLLNLFNAMKDLSDFTLEIVGSGPYENFLKEKAKELKINVNFLGVFPNSALPEIYNHYPIFILPSFYEVNPKTLLEAMSCGIPCIGTNVRGIKNIIKHKENGYLCEISPKSIADAIVNLYNDKVLQEKICKNARNHILENNSLDSTVEKEFLLYKETLIKSN